MILYKKLTLFLFILVYIDYIFYDNLVFNFKYFDIKTHNFYL